MVGVTTGIDLNPTLMVKALNETQPLSVKELIQ